MNRQMSLFKPNRNTLFYLTAFLVPAMLMLILFIRLNVTPFGNRGVGIVDGDIQYVDFFRYYRNVLLGKDSIAYSFSNFFGETSIALFAYYLASPLNLFIVLFPVGSEQAFFTFLTVLKVALAGLTSSLLLRNTTKLPELLTLCLSTGYAMMQYNFLQTENIMWLDGMVFLPFMVLGLFRLMEGKRSYLYLLALAGSVLCNWYTAYFNCIGILVFFLWWLFSTDDDSVRTLKGVGTRFGKLALHTVGGLLLSAGLFLPTVLDLLQGKAAETEAAERIFVRNILNITSGFSVGSRSFPGLLVLFCGSMAFFGLILYFLQKDFSARQKGTSLLVLMLFVCMCYYEPLEFVVNGFRDVTRYWYRYAYLPVLFVVLLAAFALDKVWEHRGEDQSRKLLAGAVIGDVLLLLPNLMTGYGDLVRIMQTVLLLAAEAIAFAAILNKPRVSAKAALASVVAFELLWNGVLVYTDMPFVNVEEYRDYTTSQSKLAAQLKEYDKTFYRTAELDYRGYGENNTTLYYNGPMADSFPGITHYSSTAHADALYIMKDLGYSDYTMFTVYSTHLLPAESLLGVKYVLGSDPYPGYTKVDLPEKTFRPVWENPSYIASALVLPADRLEPLPAKAKARPLQYQEAIYTQLTGHPVSFYEAMNVSETRNGKDKVRYQISPKGEKSDDPVYFQIPISENADDKFVTDLVIDRPGKYKGEDIIRQHGWLAPSFIEVPAKSWDKTTGSYRVALDYNQKGHKYIKEASAWQLDTEALQKAAGEVSRYALDAENLKVENGHVTVQVPQAGAGEDLLLMVPADKGWTVRVNGNDVTGQTGKFLDCFFTIPLEEGENTVELKYHVPGLAAGIAVSAVSAAALIGACVLQRKRKNE